ncbi:HD domain-containing protein [Curtobacterium sp. MCBD17_040]|uniref:HD domain-containing protein n=1 Tax=Curtobacterium sp. MCBD17_040 TaxID=2175674 RepID=UPI0015E8D82A|nr:HD domain-containing protein [Curtobacterium sp. MCBD17_040]WIB65356.1 HD domain-containing protein [Curtobacterium sp. MCBD17_040]
MNHANPLPTLGAPLADADEARLSWFIVSARRSLAGDGGTALLLNAIEHAVAAHRAQQRVDRNGNRVPYVLHPLRNTARLLMFGVVDHDVLVASLLHDTVEDVPDALVVALTGGDDLAPLAAIRAEYGPVAADTVAAVTNPSEIVRLPRAERNAAYVEHVAAVVSGNPRAVLVKAVDFLDNAGSLPDLAGVNPAMAKRLAAKYQPLVAILDTALAGAAVAAFTDHVAAIRAAVRSTGDALNRILAA